MIPVRTGQALSSSAGASGSRPLADLCARCTKDDLVPSVRVPASDKAIKQNWCCTVLSIRANMYTVAPSLGQSLPGPSLEKDGVWPPSVVRPLGVQGQCMEGKSHSYVLSGFGDHLLRMTPNPCPKPTALPTLGPRQLGPSWMLPPACPIGPPSEFLGLTSLLLPPWPGAASLYTFFRAWTNLFSNHDNFPQVLSLSVSLSVSSNRPGTPRDNRWT